MTPQAVGTYRTPMPLKRRPKVEDPHRYPQLNVRLSDEARALLDQCASYHGLTRTATLELILRHYTRKEGIGR